jgi:acyl-CoA thioesterase I
MRYGFLLALVVCVSAWAAGWSALVANLNAGKSQIVVAYGTSLTAGGAWVDQLQQALDKKFPGLVKVINSGGDSMWSKWGMENLDERVIQKAPDAVIIEFAINDAFLQYQTSTDDCRRNLVGMIDRILTARLKCQIILMTMNPPVGVHLKRRPKIESYYEVYRQVAKERRLLLIDHYRNWADLLKRDEVTFKKYVPDGVHPNALGCEKIILPQLLKSLGVLK